MSRKLLVLSPEDSKKDIMKSTSRGDSFDDKKRKQVRFESAVHIQLIAYDYKEDDIRACWYGIHDLHKFEHDNQRMAHRMMKKSLSDVTNSTEYDLDGFECPMIEIGAISKCQEMGRTTVINTILRAQAKQKVSNISCSMYVPTMSKRLTKKDKEAAHVIALRNEKYVQDYCISKTTDERSNLEIRSHKQKSSVTPVHHHSIINNRMPKKHYSHRNLMKPITH